MLKAVFILSLAVFTSVTASAKDVFVERKLLLYPSCRTDVQLPDSSENLAIIALNDLGEVNPKPCDRTCMTEKRYGVADAKQFPVLNELLRELKKTKPASGPIKPDGFIALPDLGVCLFVDSIKSRIELGGKVYSFDPQILHRLRESVKPAPPKFQ